jgi:hypothetical protein
MVRQATNVILFESNPTKIWGISDVATYAITIDPNIMKGPKTHISIITPIAM